MECIHCGVEVHPKRVEILQKNNKPITCLEHSAEQKVQGFQVNEGKAERYIQINTPEQTQRLNKLSRKRHGATGGPQNLWAGGKEPGKIVYKGPKK